jgi:hypothetical protein
LGWPCALSRGDIIGRCRDRSVTRERRAAISAVREGPTSGDEELSVGGRLAWPPSSAPPSALSERS